MPPLSQASRFTFCRTAIILCAALALAACQGKPGSLGGGDAMTTASLGKTDAPPSFKKTEELAKAWEQDKGNVQLGMAYADSLGKLGQAPAQARVLKAVADASPGDPVAQAAIGKKLLAANATQDAITVLERAVQLNGADWQVRSALGSAYDQKTMHAQAREQYKAALALQPGNIGVRNNLAMSHALQGKLPEAEKMLRELMADGSSDAMPRVRQNLALVVGLQGRFDEAKRIASEDLPPDQVEANMAYLQQMLSQPNTWAKLQED